MKNLIHSFVVLAVSTFVASSDVLASPSWNGSLTGWWTAIEKNNEGVESLRAELSGDAHNKFVEALAEDPFMAELHLNLGLAFEMNEEDKKALSEYLLAIKFSESPEVKFFSWFNAARIFGKKKQYRPALAAYQKALDIAPDSLEVKTNIELLMKQQQQQKGGGKGQGKDKNKDKNKDKKDDKKDGPVVNRRKQKPKPFQSQHLTKKDVEKILEELKNQEQKVRRKQNKKSAKETAREKDW